MRQPQEVQSALSAVIPSLHLTGARPPLTHDELVRAALEWLGLTQVQIAALLAISPQAVSKGLREEGLDYLARDNRVQPLHQALAHIGGDRYAEAAARLRDAARVLGWGSLDAPVEEFISPRDLYSFAEELWVLADNPATVVHWNALRDQMIAAGVQDNQKLIVFFTRTLEGAERWAELLEREFARDALLDDGIDWDRASVASCNLYIIVTNALAFAQDHILIDPGSRCMGLSSTIRPALAYNLAGPNYTRIKSPNLDFIRICQSIGLGTSNLKSNFFPKGVLLRSEILDFRHVYIDGIIAARGPKHEEDESASGDLLAGGVLRGIAGRPPQTIAFNKRAKFTPLFLLTYKRRPGEGLNRNPKKSIRALQEEFDRTRDVGQDLQLRGNKSLSFW